MMKHKLYLKLTAFLCAFAFALALMPVAYAADGPAVTENQGCYNYGFYAAYVKRSFLFANTQGGLTRVEYNDKVYGADYNKIIVEDYSSSFQLQARHSVEKELPQWGGFFAGKDANFFVFAQTNMGESDNAEVFRVVKYSRDWKRLGSASLYGGNTLNPVSSGTVAFAELNGNLYIRTCHTMYKSSDGLHHQANMTLVVQESDMSMKESYYEVGGDPYGYVSHSFNQFVLADQSGNIVCLDHGDAYPRAIVLHRDRKQSIIQTFPGGIGENGTGASVGGFAETSSGYVTAYNYAGSDNGNILRSVYLGYTSKDGLQSKTIKVSQLGANNPMLVPTGLNGGYLIWTDTTNDEYTAAPYEKDFFYTSYTADGGVGAVQRISGPVPLSDCQPIYWNNKVVWYVTDNSAPIFYTLDSSGIKKIPANGTLSSSTSAGETATAFSDVPAAFWGYNDIQNLVNRDIASGYPDGTFKPNNRISYIEFIAMVVRATYSYQLEQKAEEMSGSPWYMPVLKVAETGGMLWYTAMEEESRWTQVMNQPITRAEMAQVIDRAIFVGDNSLSFDYDMLTGQISDWASVHENNRDSVIQSYAAGILTGYPDGSIRPKATATRAEACVIVSRGIRVDHGEHLPDAKDIP